MSFVKKIAVYKKAPAGAAIFGLSASDELQGIFNSKKNAEDFISALKELDTTLSYYYMEIAWEI